MKKMIEVPFILLLVILFAGCASLRKGECRDVECRVLGVDASIPIPFAKGVNIMNIRLGWVETKYVHGYDTSYKSEAKQEIKYLGTAHRTMEIKP